MYSAMKYVIIRHEGHLVPILASNLINHTQLAGAHVVVSAGKVAFYFEEPDSPISVAHGSDSLKIRRDLEQEARDYAFLLQEFKRTRGY